jgi:hypothetical protein
MPPRIYFSFLRRNPANIFVSRQIRRKVVHTALPADLSSVFIVVTKYIQKACSHWDKLDSSKIYFRLDVTKILVYESVFVTGNRAFDIHVIRVIADRSGRESSAPGKVCRYGWYNETLVRSPTPDETFCR